jgi:5-amino-6-(5-phospho-D-ribitylamino)uracil phosphatase
MSRPNPPAVRQVLALPPMTPKLFAFDLDGTLIDRDEAMHPTTLAAVAELRRAGHTVTVITGRTEQTARPFIDRLAIDVPYATAQGARVATTTGEVLFEADVPEAVVRRLVAEVGDQAWGFFVATHDGFYVLDDEIRYKDGDEDNQAQGGHWAWAYRAGHRLLSYKKYGTRQPTHAKKVVFYLHEHTSADVLQDELTERFPELCYYPWDDHYLEVTHGTAHKGHALALLAGHLGFAQADTVVFGDGHNDLSMFAWAGHAVAVGDSHPSLRPHAHARIAGPHTDALSTWVAGFLAGVHPA